MIANRKNPALVHAPLAAALGKALALLAVLCLSMPALGAARRAYAADSRTEQQLISVLNSGASLQEKDEACAQLKHVGTARCVPALAALLGDEQLSQSARYALEHMSCPEAGRALIKALAQTSGPTQVGIIDSLGVRAEARAVSPLTKLLAASDPAVATAAATSLGRISTPSALKALQQVPPTVPAAVHRAVVDGTLRCANRLVASRANGKALKVFQRLYDTETEERFRVAAFRGMILASDKQALQLMTQALTGPQGPAQTAAIQLVHEVKLPQGTKPLTDLLPQVAPAVQAPLIGGLAQRDDPVAAPAIAALAASPVPAVRLAAIDALGVLGDASCVSLLARSAATRADDEQKAARQALVDLRRGPVTETLLSQLTTAAPAVQAELARALGDRSDQAAVPKLMQLARQDSGSARKASFQALAHLVDEPQLDALVQLVLEAKDETGRAQAAEALNMACQHIQAKHGRVNVEPLVKGVTTGPTEGRVALLPVCSSLAKPSVRAALRAAVLDSLPQVRAAAIRALCDTTDPELVPDVLKLACNLPEEDLRSLAVNGAVRLLIQEESVKLPTPKRVEGLKAILATPLRADQKRLVLGGLGELPDFQALKLVDSLLDDAEVSSEAARAAIKLAPAIRDAHTKEAAALLKKLIGATSDSATREAAEAALNQVQLCADFITCWQVAGPYRQSGKDYSALFDIPFPPEAANSRGVAWQPMPVGTDPKRPWLMDLLKALGGEQCVAYVRTCIHADHEGPARLEIGADDGVKVWFNDKMVHANNVARGLTAGSDKVNVTLKPGWNTLLLKITQLNQGWEYCGRLVKRDGSHLDGLQFAATREAAQP
jgi:HEAT repeat protein